MNPILYIVVNKELNMTAGKVAAQVAHACMLLDDNHHELFISNHRRTIIVLEAKNSEQIKNLQTYLDEAGIWADYYIDEGANEVLPYSVTALVVEPIDADDNEKRKIFLPFKLFTGNSYVDAWEALSRVVNDKWGLLGAPWHVNRTISWLFKHKGDI